MERKFLPEHLTCQWFESYSRPYARLITLEVEVRHLKLCAKITRQSLDQLDSVAVQLKNEPGWLT